MAPKSDDSTAPIPAECQSFLPTVIIPIQRRLVRVLRTAAPMSCCGRLTVLLAWVSADSESTHGPIHQFSGGSPKYLRGFVTIIGATQRV